jgi:hypothetical protein
MAIGAYGGVAMLFASFAMLLFELLYSAQKNCRPAANIGWLRSPC